jgi:hypothetical protein
MVARCSTLLLNEAKQSTQRELDGCSRDMQHGKGHDATRCVQRAACNTLRATRSMQRACGMQRDGVPGADRR